MMNNHMTQVSRRLSLVLRHDPGAAGLILDAQGWTDVALLLDALRLDPETLARVVAENNKQRFELSPDGTRIRARQGHSVAVDLGYAATPPPETLYHGTALHVLDAILQEGLTRQKRHHVHLSADYETAVRVGQRHGKPVVLEVAAGRMAAAGVAFFVTDNGVWLCGHVPPAYLTQLDAGIANE